ncbi:MAG: citrate synthase/methylcitrate synthase [Candidatus Promineifilaceae bacterium]|nr:citrate synthase/methylcitrate synthase [Candidatus Promineifilaceae bacterium]
MDKNNGYIRGLQGVIAAETRLSSVDGHRGKLIIGGYPLHILAANASFEEVVYLLWHGHLPDRAQLAKLAKQLSSVRALPKPTMRLLREAAKRQMGAMDALRMAAGTLDLDVDTDLEIALVARFPTIIAAYWRLRQGLEPVAPDPALGHAANYLYMLTGNRPTEIQARAVETYLNTVSDHGLNASTFTARTIISTGSDMVSAVVGAIGALKGPLHGGAPGPALDMVFEIGPVENAEPYMRRLLDRGERLMGFGHRVYKVRDPRADVLGAAAEMLYTSGNAIEGDMELYQRAKEVEHTAVALLEEYKPGRHLQTNVEYYTALLLHGLGLPTDLFSPTFAAGRVAGWIGHCREQQENGRLIRPSSRYIGDQVEEWTPVEYRKAVVVD